MHRSSASGSNGGGLFKGANIFGSGFGSGKTPTPTPTPAPAPNARPSTSTSSASPPTTSDSFSAFSFSTSTSKTSAFGRKASLSTSKSPRSGRARNISGNISGNLSGVASTSTSTSTTSPTRRAHSSANIHTESHHPLPATRGQDLDGATSPDSFGQVVASVTEFTSPVSSKGSASSTRPYANMLARPGTASTNGPQAFAPMQPPSPSLENITYQHIQETASKRISTLDYLRKAHEGRVYWFNTLLFNKPDLQKMPYFDSRKLARRATNYLLLGLSLPTVLDLNANAVEFLRTLNALLAEFESYQSIHPPDGSSSLSRGRFPQMFKRATGTVNKGRRTSSAAEIGLPMGNDSFDAKANGGSSSAGANGTTSFAVNETDLLPGEEYTFLLTPSLPFDPDFYETFATLCDVLIDCYTKLMSLVASPRDCNPTVAEMFTKADSRVRKIIVQGVVKEFEDSSRAGVKSEVAGVGRVVLGGLM